MSIVSKMLTECNEVNIVDVVTDPSMFLRLTGPGSTGVSRAHSLEHPDQNHLSLRRGIPRNDINILV